MTANQSILLVALIIPAAGYPAPSSESDADLQSTQEKSHTLFMGVDVSVEKDGSFYRVRDVSGSSWIITVNGRPEIIPTEWKRNKLRMEPLLKLTEASATLANLKSGRAYTPGNDPKMRSLTSQIQLQAEATDQVSHAEMKLQIAIKEKAFGTNGNFTPPPPEDYSRRAPDSVDLAMQNLDRALNFASSNIADRNFHQAVEGEQLEQENFDAIEVEFEVSSAKPLPNPYIVVVAQFHEKEAAPGVAQNWIYAQSLNPIDSTSRKVHLLRGGFPSGYILEKVDVHLYDRGREVATNLSPKRVPLTREEAFEYLVIEHITGNKGATVGATPVMVALPAELWTRLAAGQGQQVYHVKVTKGGLVEEVFEDEDCTRTVEDPFFAQALKKIWFKPALENGKPVASKTKVDVTKLRL